MYSVVSIQILLRCIIFIPLSHYFMQYNKDERRSHTARRSLELITSFSNISDHLKLILEILERLFQPVIGKSSRVKPRTRTTRTTFHISQQFTKLHICRIMLSDSSARFITYLHDFIAVLLWGGGGGWVLRWRRGRRERGDSGGTYVDITSDIIHHCHHYAPAVMSSDVNYYTHIWLYYSTTLALWVKCGGFAVIRVVRLGVECAGIGASIFRLADSSFQKFISNYWIARIITFTLYKFSTSSFLYLGLWHTVRHKSNVNWGFTKYEKIS